MRLNLHVAVIGAGIAGLATSRALLRGGVKRVEVFDSEKLVFAQSSGRNAAIYRPLENDPAIALLAAESLPLLQSLGEENQGSLLRQSGLLLLHHRKEALIRAQENARNLDIHAEFLSQEKLKIIGSKARLHHKEAALWSPAGGVLDPHAIGQALQKTTKDQGALLHLKRTISELLVKGQSCYGLRFENGEELHVDAVVLAAGAANGRLGFSAGSPLPLLNLQRHLALLETASPLCPDSPVVWQLDPEVYFRPESGHVLCSPCDESPRRSETPQASLEALSSLETRLNKASSYFQQARLRRHWACIRTKAPDNRPVIGADPSIKGLYWLAGLGGFGMSCGLAAGERLARCLQANIRDGLFDPGRFRHDSAASMRPFPSLKL